MPITLVTKGDRDTARRELDRRNIAAIVVDKLETSEPTTCEYTKVLVLDTPENQTRIQQWFGEGGRGPFPDGTLLHFSYGKKYPAFSKVEIQEVA